MKHAPVLVLDVDKDFEHDAAVQGVLMAQVGTAEAARHGSAASRWHGSAASCCREHRDRGQSLADLRVSASSAFFHGKK